MLTPPLRSKVRSALLLCLLSVVALAAHAATLNVGPGQQYTTIQSAINAAAAGDTVLVAPGTYYEQLTCAKAINIVSSAGAASTFIDGSRGTGFIVTIGTPLASDNSFRAPAVLDGFTLQNSSNPAATFASDGGGITIGGNATVRNNTLLDNYPSGITVRLSNALIQNNHILQSVSNLSAPHISTGIAIASPSVFPYAYLSSPPSLTVSGNLIESNYGNGILNYYATQNDAANYPAFPYQFNYTNNVIRNNGTSTQTAGLSIYAFGGNHVVAGNLITGNGGTGLVMELGASTGSVAPFQPMGVATNNTIVSNNASGKPNQGTEFSIFGVPQTVTNNLVIHTATTSTPALYCGQGSYGLGGTPIITQPALDHNDLYAPNSPALTPSGTGCVGTWTNNRFEDPLFANASTADFHLTSASPEIDTGNNAALGLPATDLDAKARIVDGSGKGIAIVDLGAYEYSGPSFVSETLQSSLNPAFPGQSVTFTASLTASAGTPTGTVQFLDGTTALAVQPIASNGTSTFSSTSLTLGSHKITAAYQPTGAFTATSASLVETIAYPSTNTALSCAPSTSFFFDPVTLVANVTEPAGNPVNGIVTFTEGTFSIGQATIVNGTATFTTSNTTALNTGTITATAYPTGGYGNSTGTCQVTVQNRNVTVSLASSLNPSSVGQPVTFTATVLTGTPPAPVPGLNNVLFTDGIGTTIGGGNLNSNGQASITTTTLTPGAHDITVYFYPPQGYNAGNATVHQQITTQPTTTTTLTCNPSLIPINATALFSATVKGSDATTPAGTVAFTDNGTPLGQPLLVNGNTSLTYTGIAAGSHTIVATTFPTGAYSGSSATCTEVVTLKSTTLALVTSQTPAGFAQPVTFTATASYPGNSPSSNGTVTFSDGATALQTVPVGANLTAAFTTASLTPGTHTINATLNPVAGYNSSSAFLQQVIKGYPTASNFLNPPSSSTQANYGTPLTVSAVVVSATLLSTAVPTGNIEFFLDGVQIGPVLPLSNGRATQPYTGAPLAIGTHQLACFYFGDAIYDTSTCGIDNLTIVQAPTTTTLAATPTTVYVGQTVNFLAKVDAGPVPAQGPLSIGYRRTVIASTNGNTLPYATSFATPGTYSYTANYAGDMNTLSSSSPSAIITVLANTSATLLSVTPQPGFQNQPVTLTAIVTNPANLASSALVTFFDRAQTIGTATLSAGQATLVTTRLAPGTHLLLAVFAGDTATPGSTSQPVTENILQSDFTFAANPPTITLSTGHHTGFSLAATSIGMFSGPLTLSVDPLPGHATLNLAQYSITLPQGGQTGTTAYLDTDDVLGYLSSTRPTPPRSFFAPFTAILLLPLAFYKRRRRLPTLLILLLSAITLTTGCSGKYPASVTPGTYNLRITASSQAGVAHTATIQLNVTN